MMILKILDCILIMNDQLIDNSFAIKKSYKYQQSPSTSPLTDIADSGVVSRVTPSSSSINENKLNINQCDDNDRSTINQNRYLSINLVENRKRMIIILLSIFLFCSS
jgi:hypothetical protein